jgi:hypothetical protein
MSEAEGVQPAAEGGESQGAEGNGGLYDLSAVPEDLRSQVEPLFKQFDANVTKKFQEHADYRKGWEPYENLGLNEYDPEGLQQLLQFAEQNLTSEDALREFVTNTARENGWLDDGEPDPEMGEDDPVQGELEDLRQQLSQITERDQAREQQQREQQIGEYITQEYERLKTEVGELPDEEAQDWVDARAAMYASDPEKRDKAIETAYRDYFAMIAKVETGLLKRKGDQPPAPEQGGRPGTGEPPNTDRKVARQRAEERLRRAHSP